MESLFRMRTLALVGAGYWGKNLARNFHAIGALHTICDAKERLLESYREPYPDVCLTTDYQAILDNPEIRQIALASPVFKHHEMAKQALLAGKDCYVEKPLCMTVEEGEELVRMAEERNLILMVGHILQYHPCVQKLQEMVHSGELGHIHYISSHRLNLGILRVEENALWNFAPHDISVILSLCGDRLPEQIRCVGDACITQGVVDLSVTTMRFAENTSAHIYVSWLNPFKEQKLVLVGSKGLAVFDDTRPWHEKLMVCYRYVKWTQEEFPLIDNTQLVPVEVAQAEPLKEECLHFLQCCKDRQPPKTDGREGVRVLRVLEAAQKSMTRQGCLIDCRQQVGDFFHHPTAIVSPEAKIGSGTKIWHFSHIMQGAEIGPECNIGQNVVIASNVRLGRNCKVQNNVSLYTGVTAEDDVFFGPGAVFTNVINPRSEISRKAEFQTTHIGRGATIGANATIVCGNTLGDYCFVGAGAVVTKDVAPFALVIGNPAKQVGWMNREGQRVEVPPACYAGEPIKVDS